MSKRIDELPLDDSPIEHQHDNLEALDHARDRDQGDERDQPWYQFLGTIDDLLATGQYDWAFDSLAGIRETVEKTRRVTEGQQRAVKNIEARGEARARGTSRRYEGYGGPWR